MSNVCITKKEKNNKKKRIVAQCSTVLFLILAYQCVAYAEQSRRPSNFDRSPRVDAAPRPGVPALVSPGVGDIAVDTRRDAYFRNLHVTGDLTADSKLIAAALTIPYVLWVHKGILSRPDEFSSVKAAVDSITDNGPTHRYVINVDPGIYQERTITMKPYVAIQGVDNQSVIIEAVFNSEDIIVGSDQSTVAGVMLRHGGVVFGSGAAALNCDALTGQMVVQNCIFGASDILIKMDMAVAGTVLIENMSVVPTAGFSYGFKISNTVGAAYSSGVLVNSLYWAPTSVMVSGIRVADVSGSGAFFTASGVQAGSPTITPAANTRFVYFKDGAKIRVTNSIASGFDKAFYADVGAHATEIQLSSVIGVNNTSDVTIADTQARGAIAGMFSRSKITIDPAVHEISLLITETGTQGITALGPLYVATTGSSSQITNISPQLNDASTLGLLSGGVLAASDTTLTVTISAGCGYIKKSSGDSLYLLEWAQTETKLYALRDNFIYLNESGLPITSLTQPTNIEQAILLGKARTNATGVRFVQNIPRPARHEATKTNYAQETVFGPVYVSGSSVTRNSTGNVALNVTTGDYFYGSQEFQPQAVDGVLFDSYYGGAAGSGVGSLYSLSTGSVDYAHYDNGVGITPLTSGKYAKHELFVIDGGASTKYAMVYGQAEFNDAATAISGALPARPTTWTGDVVPIASIVVCNTGTAFNQINSINSERPLPGFAASAVAGTSYHGALLGLDQDDHLQYLNRTGVRPMTGDLSLGNQSITNVNQINTVNKIIMPATSGANYGVIAIAATMLHAQGTTGNFFAGKGAGNFTTTSSNNIGIGSNSLAAVTTGNENIAIGANANASLTTASNTVVVGNNALASGNSAAAFGPSAQATATDAIAIGDQSVARALDATALGFRALASGSGSTALGEQSTAGGDYSLALGPGSSSSGTYAISLGLYASSNVDHAISLGYYAAAKGVASFAACESASATAANSIALGLQSVATGGVGNVAIGQQANANSTVGFATAIGGGANAAGEKGNAIGWSADASATNAIAIGTDSAASSGGAIAIGGTATATGTDGIAIGTGVTAASGKTAIKNIYGTTPGAVANITLTDSANVLGTIALSNGQILIGSTGAKPVAAILASSSGTITYTSGAGSLNLEVAGGSLPIVAGENVTITTVGTNKQITSSTGSGLHSVKIGPSSNASAADTVAIGYGALATNTAAIAIGAAATGSGQNAVTMGHATYATNLYSTAVGSYAGASGQYATALGTLATAINEGSLAVGTSANSSGQYATAVGYNPDATGTRALAVGYEAQASGSDAIAIGKSSTGSATDAIAIGDAAQASGTGSVAIGANAACSGTVAIGSGASANYADSIAVGHNAVSNNIKATALGYTATALGIGAVAIGELASVTSGSAYGIAVGNQSTGNGSYSIALGCNSNASGNKAMAFGFESFASGNSALTIGSGAQALASNAIALGQGASAMTGNMAVFGGSSTGAGRIQSLLFNVGAGSTGAGLTAVGAIQQQPAPVRIVFGYITYSGGVYSKVYGSGFTVSNSGSDAIIYYDQNFAEQPVVSTNQIVTGSYGDLNGFIYTEAASGIAAVHGFQYHQIYGIQTGTQPFNFIAIGRAA